jgi:hypothetical protein
MEIGWLSEERTKKFKEDSKSMTLGLAKKSYSL